MRQKTLQQVEKRLKMRKSPTIDVLVKQVVLHTFSQMQIKARTESQCPGGHVASSILEIDMFNELIAHHSAISGQSYDSKSSSKYYCDCSHAESRVVMKYLKCFRKQRENIKTILITTVNPCIHCANIIIDSELIDIVVYDRVVSSLDGNRKINGAPNVRLWSKALIEEDIENNYIKSWLSRS